MVTQQSAILLRKQRFPNCKNNSRVPRNPCQDFISRHSRRSHSHIIRVQVSKGPSDYNYQCFVKFGQFNGTVGNVMDIICSRGKSPQDEFPNFILVEFPKFKPLAFFHGRPSNMDPCACNRPTLGLPVLQKKTGSIATRICDNHSQITRYNALTFINRCMLHDTYIHAYMHTC